MKTLQVNWAADDEIKEFTPPASPRESPLDGAASTSGIGSGEVATSSQTKQRTDSVESGEGGSSSPTKPTARRITIM